MESISVFFSNHKRKASNSMHKNKFEAKEKAHETLPLMEASLCFKSFNYFLHHF